jgi:hypothetical protein
MYPMLIVQAAAAFGAEPEGRVSENRVHFSLVGPSVRTTRRHGRGGLSQGRYSPVPAKLNRCEGLAFEAVAWF